MTTETNLRSFLKSLGYSVLGSFITSLITYVLTRNLELSVAAGIFSSSSCPSSATNFFYAVPNPTGTAAPVTCIINECTFTSTAATTGSCVYVTSFRR